MVSRWECSLNNPKWNDVERAEVEEKIAAINEFLEKEGGVEFPVKGRKLGVDTTQYRNQATIDNFKKDYIKNVVVGL